MFSNLQHDLGFILNTPVTLAHHCSHLLVIRVRRAHYIVNIVSLNRQMSAVPNRMGCQTSSVTVEKRFRVADFSIGETVIF